MLETLINLVSGFFQGFASPLFGWYPRRDVDLLALLFAVQCPFDALN